ncbi:MAG TPA: DUF445 domain-containing protein [Acidimicrobiales bacterium]
MTATLPRSAAEDTKRAQLAVMRRRATLFLVGATAVFAVTTTVGGDAAWVGYVQATAEASMVGGLADWFAVVALFRHPLGLPIPHTAIIVARKNQFGETLGDFIQSSFLTADAVVARLQSAQVGLRLSRWLSEPANADRVAGALLSAAVTTADLVREEELNEAVGSIVRQRVEAADLATPAARALRFAIDEDRHRPLVDAALRALDRYLDEHRDDLHARFEERSPWWLPGAVEDRVFSRLLDGAHVVLDDMAGPDSHGLRRDLDDRLRLLADGLETSEALRDRVDQVKRDLLAQPELGAWVDSAWTTVKEGLRAQSTDPGSELRRRLALSVAELGRRLEEEPPFRMFLESAGERAVRQGIERFGGEITDLVATTVERWDGEETADRLELLLGPDLQFIRINGTVVGGLAGLVLHTIADLAA